MGRLSGWLSNGVFVSRGIAIGVMLFLGGGAAFAATGLLQNVPEAAGYTLVYEFPIPTGSPGWGANLTTNPYTVNVSASIANGSFDRVAYYLELVKTSGETQWVYVSATAFTTNAAHLGIPRNTVLRNGAYDTAAPSNAVIRSNVSGITTGDGINTVNLEFWPSDYSQANGYSVPGASASTYDFGDNGASTTAGHGSMQIHNYGAGETLFAYNNWGTSQSACALGIGNQIGGSGNPDWTFNSTNIANYTSRTLQVLVRQLSVNNLAATNVTDVSGWMNGQISSPGINYDVYVYWGGVDGANVAGQWGHSAYVGSYSDGLFGLTYQATDLTGGVTNFYTFCASNATTVAWATPTAYFVPMTAPAVDNSLGASVSVGQADLCGTLTAGGVSDIYVYWGYSDGGQSANYDHVVKLSQVSQGAFSTTISACSGFPCYYVCWASNVSGTAWSPASSTFTLPVVSNAIEYANGLRGSVFQSITSGKTAVDLSGAAYVESVTRVPTGTKSGTVLALAEVSGKNIVLQGPANTWTEFGGSLGDNFVAALSGRFYPTVTGTYTFRWNQDDVGWMFIDSGDDGVFDSGDAVGFWQWACTATKTLTAGQGYNFMFFSQEYTGSDNLSFWYTPPGGTEAYVSPSAQAGQWRYPSRMIPKVSIANVPMNGDVTGTAATLTGNLYGKGLSFDVYVFWGTADGGSVAANWSSSAYVGRYDDWNAAVSQSVSDLTAGSPVYYTFFVSNAVMNAWATPSQSFVPGTQVSIAATDASASEDGDTGTFQVTRTSGDTSAALTVYYTLGGSAGNGVDYATLSGSVTIPAGSTSADIVVSPINNEIWGEGNKTVVATLAGGNYGIADPDSATVDIQGLASSDGDWQMRMPIVFSGYNRSEVLTNFPVLVTLGTQLPGFDYDQFSSGANFDLRFTDGSMTLELPYEIESWDTGGQSRVWVRVPALTNNATVWMLWQKSGLTEAPAYTTNGTVWSSGYVVVAHATETSGSVQDSSPYKNFGTQSGFPIMGTDGLIGGCDQFDGMDDIVVFGTAGRMTNSFSFSAWVKTSLPHQLDAESNSSSVTTGTSGQQYAFDAENSGDTYYCGAGLSVGTNGISVYEHGSSYMPPVAAYTGDLGTNWNYVCVSYTNRASLIYLNGALVRKGLVSARVRVNAPYKIGGQGNGYGYFTGSMDEARISAVPRSADWIWAEYMNMASNTAFATYGAGQTVGHAEIANRPASGVSSTAATLNGYLVSTGMADTVVAVYWGAADGGTNVSAWANAVWLSGSAAPGAVAQGISGLTDGSAYYYRFVASNAYGLAWAPVSETLFTGSVTLQATDASAAESPLDTGVVTVSRGVALDAPLTVYYSLSGTAENGTDMTSLGGSVTIPAGSASADITVTPLFNRNYQTRATDTVTLTLSACGYVVGSPSEGTVTITNWQPSTGTGADVPRNFLSSSLDPFTGTETFSKTSAGQMMFGGTTANTFSGDITVDTDGGILRLGGVPGASAGTGVTLPNMTAANTITVKRGGTLFIDDNGTYSSTGSKPNRFGSEGDRPSVSLAGGALTLNGASYATTVQQNLGTLTLGPGFNNVNSIRSSGTPELVFKSVTQATGSHVNFTSASTTTTLGLSSNAPRIRFTSPPVLVGGGGASGSTTMSIMPGARCNTDWVTHDGATGIRPLSSNEYNVILNNDVNTAGVYDNVRLTNSIMTNFAALASDKIINSLIVNVGSNAYWFMTNKLTLTSGQLGFTNNQVVINYPATITAGSGSSDAALNVSTWQNNAYLRAVLVDNGGKLTLTKSGTATLVIDGSVDNTYSGGTYVNEGTLSVGGTANRRYLGTGPVRVDASYLWLNSYGATANASGDDYTAVNGGMIGIATAAFLADDTFNIGSGCVIFGGSVLNFGLNSLDRGIGVSNATPNVTLAADAVVAHSSSLLAPFCATNSIRNLGVNCDLFYGLAGDQWIPSGSLTIGLNTPFKGISTDRNDRRWGAGTIYVTPGTAEVTFQGLAKPGYSPNYLYMGHWTQAGAPVLLPSGALTVNILGNFVLDEAGATYGASGAPVTFAVNAGASVNVDRQNCMGSGSGLASLLVKDGGSLTFSAADGANGAVTVESGGRLVANNQGGLTGSGTITMNSGSVIELTASTGLTGPQADAMIASFQPGQIIRLGTTFGSPLDPLDAHVGSKSPIYVVYGNNYAAANPLTAGTTVMTLNHDAATGKGGMVVNDYASRYLSAAANGVLVIGPNGGTIAATSNTTFYIQQPMSIGANALTIGATDMVERVLVPKLGSVYLNMNKGYITALPGSSITVIPGATLQNTANAIPDEPDVIVNGAFLLSGAEAIGSLSGSGWVNLQATTLTVGRNNSASTFSGTLTNTSLSAVFGKVGTGRLDITSRQDFYSGNYTVSEGILALSGLGTTTNAGLSAFALYGGGTLLLDNSTVNLRNRMSEQASLLFNGGTLGFVGKDGEASGEVLGAAIVSNGVATISVANGSGTGSSVDLEFSGVTAGLGMLNITASNGTLGSSGDNPRVFFDGQAEGVIGYATVNGAPAYYSLDTGVRAYTLAEGVEFDGTTDQTGLDTIYTTANNHQALTAPRSVNSLWINNPGSGYSVNLGSSGTNNLTLASGRLVLTGTDDFSITRSGTSAGMLKRDASGSLYIGIGTGLVATVSVPISNGWGSVEKDGAGTLVLGAANLFTGSLNVNEGAVRYASGGSGDLNGVGVNVWNSGVLDFAGDTDTLGPVSVFEGGITNSVAGGALTVASLGLGGGPAESACYVQSGSGSVKLSGNVTYLANNDPDMATVGGTLDLNGGTRTFTVNNSMAANAAIDLDVPATIIGGAGYGITKNGSGIMRLCASNSFDGTVTLADSCGTVILNHPQALGKPTVGRTISMANQTTLALDGSMGPIVFPSLYTNVYLNGAGDYLIGTIRGALANWAGNNVVSNLITLTGNTVYIASRESGSKLTLAGQITGNQDLYVFGTGDTELGGALTTTSSKGLYKYGAGTLTLSGTGNNTFTGSFGLYDGTTVLAKANGTLPINAVTSGTIYIYDGAVLKYASGIINANMIATSAMTVYQNGQFDLNGASDGIGALSIYSPGAFADTVPLTNSADGGNLAVNGLTIQPAAGYLTRIDTGTGMLTLSNNVTFNSTSTGRAQIGGNLSLANATRTFTVNSGINSNYDLAIDAVVSGTAGAGITKAGSGLMRLNGANTFDGPVAVSAGTIIVGNNQGLGVPSAARAITVSSGYTLGLDGVNIRDPYGRFTLTLAGTGDQRNSGSQFTSGALAALSGSNTVSSAVTLSANTQISVLKPESTLTFAGAVTGGSYALTVVGAGVAALAGANGAIPTAGSITVSQNATLTLANTAASNKADRIGNAIPITVAGSSIRFENDGGAANFTETLGALTVSAGTNVVFASQAASSYTSALVFASVTRVAGTLNFVGEGLGEDARNRIFITGQADGMIGPWATINGTNLAMYSSARGVYAGSGAEEGIAALGNTENSVIPNDETVSAVINTRGSEGPITLASLWTNRVLEVRQETAYDSVVAMVQGVTNRTLQTSRIAVITDMASLTFGQSDNDGVLMPLSSGGTVSLENQNSSSTLTVKSGIANNGSGLAALSKFGNGTVVLSGSNSYAGATLISEGTLEFSGCATQLLAGAISGNGDLVMNGTGRLTLGTNNAYTGATTIKQGTVVANCNNAFGSTASGTVIMPGATLDVGGFQAQHKLYLQETFTVSGKGVNDLGAIVNNSAVEQGNAFGKVILAGDTTVGCAKRWDLRANTPVLTMNGYDLTKIGSDWLMFSTTYVYPNGEDRTGDININQGNFRLENWNMLNGSAANTLTIGSGSQLNFYNFQNIYPANWTLALATNAWVVGAAGSGSGYNVWSGPVALNGRAVLAPASGTSFTFTNVVSGDGSIIKYDAGTAYLNSPGNAYAGTTVVSNGTLYAMYPGSLPGYNDGRLTLGGTGFVSLNVDNGSYGFTADQIHNLYDASVFTTNTAGLSIDTSTGDLNIGYDLTKPMSLIKQGTNTLTLAGNTNTLGGTLYVYGGTLKFNSTVGTNNISRLAVGYSTTNAAAAIQEGGCIDCGSWVSGSETLGLGYGGATGYGYYRMNGGTLRTGWLSLPTSSGGNVVFDQYAGEANVVGSWFIMGWAYGHAALNIYDGTMHNNAGDLAMNFTALRNSLNMINLLGSGVLDAAGGNTTRALRMAYSGTNLASVVNLNSGTLIANRVYAGNLLTPSIFNFNGGTLQVGASTSYTANFLQGLTAATVYPGGAVFDTAGSSVSVNQCLLAPVGYGLSYAPLNSAGSGYIGAPVVVITGGSGTGATAIATVDLTDGSPTKGTVTGISVTSPGFGYLPTDTPTVALYGGGTVFPATLGDCSLGLNDDSGGLTKLGLGTLTLGGTNTYGGATVISNGVLTLAVCEALPTNSAVRLDGGTLNMGGFAITNRSLTVTSGQILNGSLVCDSVVKTGSGQWTLGTSLSSVNPIVVEKGTLKLQSSTPGLYEGILNGSFNTTESFSVCSNVTIQSGTRMADTNVKQSSGGLWGDYMTVVYSGYIWNRTGTNATWTFAESIDDNTRLKIDGSIVINDGAGWSTPMTGTTTLSPGAHAIEVRFGNGIGGAGLVYNTTGSGGGMWWTNRFGFGVDFQGHTATNAVNFITNFVACTDSGDGSLLSCTGTSSGASNLVDAASAMVLGEGTLLDLDGYVQTLASLSGSGTVSNGTLFITGTIAPGGTNHIGTLTIAANTTLGSGTLLVDVAGSSSDKLVVEGSVDLSNLDLEIADPDALDRSKVYTIMSVTGTRTGTFKSTNLPDSRWHVLYRSDGSVQLMFVNGTLMRVR